MLQLHHASKGSGRSHLLLDLFISEPTRWVIDFFLQLFNFKCTKTKFNYRTYTIVAPKILRPSLDFHVSITLHGAATTTKVDVAIEGQQDGGGLVRNSQSATVESNSTQVIKLQVISKTMFIILTAIF